MYAYFCLNAKYIVKDGEKIDEVKKAIVFMMFPLMLKPDLTILPRAE